MRNYAVTVAALYHGRMHEAEAYQALDRWLERLDGRPDLLRRALQIVRDHEARSKFDPQTVRLSQQVVIRNGVDFPSRWAARYFDQVRPDGTRRPWDQSGSTSVSAETESTFLGFAWTVPWEKERHRRAVGLGNVPGWEHEQFEYLDGMPGMMALGGYQRVVPDKTLTESENAVLASRPGGRAETGSTGAPAETGRLPATLSELVPTYLPAVAADPYDGAPLPGTGCRRARRSSTTERRAAARRRRTCRRTRRYYCPPCISHPWPL